MGEFTVGKNPDKIVNYISDSTQELHLTEEVRAVIKGFVSDYTLSQTSNTRGTIIVTPTNQIFSPNRLELLEIIIRNSRSGNTETATQPGRGKLETLNELSEE